MCGRSYVKAIDSNPPPAPASACATLSLCCAATLLTPCDGRGGFEACGRGFEDVGAATLSDMLTASVDVTGSITGKRSYRKECRDQGMYSRAEGQKQSSRAVNSEPVTCLWSRQPAATANESEPRVLGRCRRREAFAHRQSTGGKGGEARTDVLPKPSMERIWGRFVAISA